MSGVGVVRGVCLCACVSVCVCGGYIIIFDIQNCIRNEPQLCDLCLFTIRLYYKDLKIDFV